MIVEAPELNKPQPEASAAITETAPAPVAATHILQVRSYADPDSADARRAEIILNGLSADIVKTVEGGKTWYRVISDLTSHKKLP